MKIYKILAVLWTFILAVVVVDIVFGQPPQLIPKTDTAVLINIALAISGIISTFVLTFVRNKFRLSSLVTYFLYLGISVAIAVVVTAHSVGFDMTEFASSFALIFTIGQAVYQTLIKGSAVGEIGNEYDPPSITNESTALKEEHGSEQDS